jgi:large subunit ribosomal protein L17
MRHRKVGRKFGRNSAQRKSLFRNQTTALLKHGQIKTTLAKAKELRMIAEPVITLGRKHAWSKYQGLATELNAALTSLESVFAGASEEAQKAYNTVVASNEKVTQRFPSGLGALIKACKGLEGASEQLAVLHKVRAAQMARQQAIGQATSMITESDVVEMLFGQLGEQFVDRNGGYTRVVKAGNRDGDNAPMAYIALVTESASAE